jgi:hypothetical protein
MGVGVNGYEGAVEWVVVMSCVPDMADVWPKNLGVLLCVIASRATPGVENWT